ncbi:MAG: formate dehydrogenase accessory sulfurtransferase FdhD, partial [Xanthomonadales bacterium]|nr:formate dehydrogenase accessory sulfurtransferase FdhD [Xanthomonadales bacterium]
MKADADKPVQNSEQREVRRVRVVKLPQAMDDRDHLAVEEPLEIRLGFGPLARRDSRSVAVTMRTPGADEDLALGFLFTEGIIQDMGQVRSTGPCGESGESGEDQAIRVELEPGVQPDLERLQRHFYTSSSCGVCGKQSIEALKVQGRYELASSDFRVSARALAGIPVSLEQHQRVFARTGGLHAAGLFDREGQVREIREDVGRHNAVDKLVGAALGNRRVPLERNGMVVSGRASFELVQKAVVAGCPMLVAVSAPSSLAVEAAAEAGLTLVGFLREGRGNLYTGPDRL